jgi:hypothetical protein
VGGSLELFAIRLDDAEAVAQAAAEYATGRGIAAKVTRDTSHFDPDRVDVFGARDGWVVTSWPVQEVGAAAEAAGPVSDRLDTVASCVTVYEDAYWTHILLQHGKVRDRFCSRPDYFDDDPLSAVAHFGEWTGDAHLVAAVVGGSAGELAPYLVPLTARDRADRRPMLAHEDDRSDLRDPMVFGDFWRHLGITYPSRDELPRLGVTLRLPH